MVDAGEAPGAEAPQALTVAAVDLGSNSFHVIIARFLGREMQVVDRVREPVRLAEGLDESGRLDEQAQLRALACLERIGERLRGLPSVRVRAVGTNTLRTARNAEAFRVRAEAALGHTIETVSGQEEARLIHLGVSHDQYSDAQRLLVDIGGGSTEVLVGRGYEVLRSHSLYMGCVNYSRRHFPGGGLGKERFREAEVAAGLELRSIRRDLLELGWDGAVGASGSVAAIGEILRAQGWSDGPIVRSGLKKLRRAMIEAGTTERLRLAGLRGDRAPVLPGGLAILRAVFRALELESMEVAGGALREGLLHDLVGRIREEDMRDHTIRRMVERYHVDLGQTRRVERVALRLLERVAGGWGLDPGVSRKQLAWAAALHEIGLAVAYTGFHRHGAYLVRHSDLPGFSSEDQARLAAIVRGQRRKLSRALFADLPPAAVEPVLRLCVLLRLAVLLNRGRDPRGVPAVEAEPTPHGLILRFPQGWAAAHPLTGADLARETAYLDTVQIELRIEQAPAAAERAGRRGR